MAVRTQKTKAKSSKQSKSSTLAIKILAIVAAIYFFGFSFLVFAGVTMMICPPSFVIGFSGSCSNSSSGFSFFVGFLVAFIVPIIIFAMIARSCINESKTPDRVSGQNRSKGKHSTEYEDDSF